MCSGCMNTSMKLGDVAGCVEKKTKKAITMPHSPVAPKSRMSNTHIVFLYLNSAADISIVMANSVTKIAIGDGGSPCLLSLAGVTIV